MFDIYDDRPFSLDELARCVVSVYNDFRGQPKVGLNKDTPSDLQPFLLTFQENKSSGSKSNVGGIGIPSCVKMYAYLMAFQNPTSPEYHEFVLKGGTRSEKHPREAESILKNFITESIDKLCSRSTGNDIKEYWKWCTIEIPRIIESYTLLWPTKSGVKQENKENTDRFAIAPVLDLVREAFNKNLAEFGVKIGANGTISSGERQAGSTGKSGDVKQSGKPVNRQYRDKPGRELSSIRRDTSQLRNRIG